VFTARWSLLGILDGPYLGTLMEDPDMVLCVPPLAPQPILVVTSENSPSFRSELRSTRSFTTLITISSLLSDVMPISINSNWRFMMKQMLCRRIFAAVVTW
jgi:hypothetical protein